MNYAVYPGWVYALVVVGLLVVCVGLPVLGLLVSRRRERRQSISIENGVVRVVDSAFGGAKSISTDRIGTVVYLPERESSAGFAPITSLPLATSDTPQGQDYRNSQARATGNGANIFSYGGLIILDVDGRMVGHMAYEVGSNAPLATVWKQIPAPNYVQFPPKSADGGYSRGAFKKAFPKALRARQLWGATRWIWLIVGCVVIGLPVLLTIAFFVIAVIVVLQQPS